jgi:hypothetical protein
MREFEELGAIITPDRARVLGLMRLVTEDIGSTDFIAYSVRTYGVGMTYVVTHKNSVVCITSIRAVVIALTNRKGANNHGN